MKIAFMMRYDYIEKSGGDVIQIKAYAEQLKRLGHICTITNSTDEEIIRCNDVFFLVNIDRPVETIAYYHKIRKAGAGKFILVVPIHHPVEAITLFEKRLKGFSFRTLATVMPDFYSREKLKNLVRFVRAPSYFMTSLHHLFLNYRTEIARLLNEADGIIYISDGERLSVEKDFGVTNNKYVVAHNAVTNAPKVATGQGKLYDVIIVGRIEQRKNQLNVARAFAGSDLKVLFVGPANANSNSFVEEFRQVVDSSGDRLHYIGPKTHAETLQLIAQSRVLLNASYFEVNPLVDLEACLVGAQVVTTKYSYTREVMPNVIEFDPWELDSYVPAVKRALDGKHDTLAGAQVETSWEVAGRKIDSALPPTLK